MIGVGGPKVLVTIGTIGAGVEKARYGRSELRGGRGRHIEEGQLKGFKGAGG